MNDSFTPCPSPHAQPFAHADDGAHVDLIERREMRGGVL
jgi:hypothetical protein